MKWWFVGLFLLAASSVVCADDPSAPARGWRPWWLMQRICPSVGCCPDDYCRKPGLRIEPIGRCGGVNDYCRKPFPCVADIVRGGGCDDYCRKPLPILLCPPLTPYLKCVSRCAPAFVTNPR